MISLALNDTDSNFKDFLSGVGIIIDFLASFYLVKLNSKINNLIKKWRIKIMGIFKVIITISLGIIMLIVIMTLGGAFDKK